MIRNAFTLGIAQPRVSPQQWSYGYGWQPGGYWGWGWHWRRWMWNPWHRRWGWW